MMPGGPQRVRAAVHFAVSLPGDPERIVSVFKTGPRIYNFFDLIRWLRDGRKANRSANNVIRVYEDISTSYMRHVVDRSLGRELYSEYSNLAILRRVLEIALGVTSEGL